MKWALLVLIVAACGRKEQPVRQEAQAIVSDAAAASTDAASAIVIDAPPVDAMLDAAPPDAAVATSVLPYTPVTVLPPTGQIDGWYGPFDGDADGETSPRGTLYSAEDSDWDDEDVPHPAVAEVTWDDGDDKAVRATEEDDYADPGNGWAIAIETAAGWFVSPRLGTQANRTDCDITDVKSIGERVTIEYLCYLGRFDGSERRFVLYCGLDAAQHFACARYLTVARLETESKPKEDDSVLTTTYARSCKASVKGGTVSFRFVKPKRDEGSTEVMTIASKACPASATPKLSAKVGLGGPVPTFTRYGHDWVPPAYR